MEAKIEHSEYPQKPPYVHIAMKREDVNTIWLTLEALHNIQAAHLYWVAAGLREHALKSLRENVSRIQKYFPNPETL